MEIKNAREGIFYGCRLGDYSDGLLAGFDEADVVGGVAGTVCQPFGHDAT